MRHKEGKDECHLRAVDALHLSLLGGSDVYKEAWLLDDVEIATTDSVLGTSSVGRAGETY